MRAATAREVAEWMVEEVQGGDYVYQEAIVYEIAEKFGEKFTYTNANGNLAIGKDVLKEFRILTAETVVWLKGERAWRLREPGDEDRRQQDY